MFGQRHGRLGMSALIAGLLAMFTNVAGAGERPAKQEPVKIGMIASLFRDIPESTVAVMMQPFGAIMEAQTGVSGELVPGGDADCLGQQLAIDKVQLGVFHGIEFAWARVKYPNLRPLCIAINQEAHLRAHLLVRTDSPANTLKDLEGKVFALPRHTKEHCHLFLEKQCRAYKKVPDGFFARMTTPANGEEALDDVVDGLVQGTVVDGVTLDCYKRRKPGRFVRLRDVQASEVFPAAVVAYHPGALDEATLKRFRDGMMNANRNVLGKQLLTLWQLTSFESVPEDFEQILADIVKIYPPPVKAMK
jgi:ABC-type phosphate/phosphonate transport system substrate-binding protein